MKQLAQKLADGRPVVVDVPAPLLGDGMILVQNYYSVVSAGTEGATVRSARKNLIAKALDRPKDVKATLELMKRQGPVQAYRAGSIRIRRRRLRRVRGGRLRFSCGNRRGSRQSLR